MTDAVVQALSLLALLFPLCVRPGTVMVWDRPTRLRRSLWMLTAAAFGLAYLHLGVPMTGPALLFAALGAAILFSKGVRGAR